MTRPTLRTAGNAAQIPDALWNSAYLKACRGEPTPHTPIWLMRQAGRYMQEYRDIRAQHTFLEMCQKPEVAARVTLDAQRIIGADAAIIFADILLILETLGMGLEFIKGEGPRLAPPLRNAADLAKLGDPEQAAAACSYVADACRLTRAGLPADIPLIGFCGAPYTLASYAIEGSGARQYPHTRSLMYRDTATWHALQEKLVAALVPYLIAQIDAGAQAVQIFDSWVGFLPLDDYREYVLPHLKTLVSALPTGIAVTMSGTQSSHLIEAMAEIGADVLSVDSVTDLDAAWQRAGGPAAISVQGNLDPHKLLADSPSVCLAADRVLAAADGRPGHIFNLGHGIIKETDPQVVIDLINHVHHVTKRSVV